MKLVSILLMEKNLNKKEICVKKCVILYFFQGVCKKKYTRKIEVKIQWNKKVFLFFVHKIRKNDVCFGWGVGFP